MRVDRNPKVQERVRITRISQNQYKREDLADVSFVPLIGEEGWPSAEHRQRTRRPFTKAARRGLGDRDRNGRQSCQEARRRADGGVWLSGGARDV
jgi:hypothetical protein